ncbi:MAG: hypothetical protein JEZ11_14555 [Desulfobacterales bacterium]|nr:hypothetical protein [Desulfobacterales bacterium]
MTSAAEKFEGPEKKLEVILRKPLEGIRDHADGRWHRVVKACRAEIVSRIFTDQMDAYLLSESSLFVWTDRILMITCGRTMLTRAVPAILEIVGRENVALVFYERKNFMYPSEQPADFEQDVEDLASCFPGKSYRLGPANHDHVHVFYASQAGLDATGDATLQVLMHDLDPSLVAIFGRQNGGDVPSVRRRSGLMDVYPHMAVDGHLFSPYGFSINGIDDDRYYTIHVTPQPDGSYASFETNIIEPDYGEIVRMITAIFKPGRFSTVLTTSIDGTCMPLHPKACRAQGGYALTEKSLYEFDCGYAVSFINQVRT